MGTGKNGALELMEQKKKRKGTMVSRKGGTKPIRKNGQFMYQILLIIIKMDCKETKTRSMTEVFSEMSSLR